MRKKHLIFLTALFLLLVSCDRKVFYADNKRVEEDGWNLNDKLYFDVEVKDVKQLYSFFIDLRVSNNYPYDRAFFFINTTFPDGGVAADTLGCPLADVDGSWYGSRTGGYIDNRYLFKQNIIFPEPGSYRFEIVHAMRDTNIIGIKNVGMRIEYAK